MSFCNLSNFITCTTVIYIVFIAIVWLKPNNIKVSLMLFTTYSTYCTQLTIALTVYSCVPNLHQGSFLSYI